MGLYLGKEKISNVASVITQNADSMATEIQNHIADTNIHITADERTKWNAAAENSSSPTEDFASTGIMNTNLNMNANNISRIKSINFVDGAAAGANLKLYMNVYDTDILRQELNDIGMADYVGNSDYTVSFWPDNYTTYAEITEQININDGSTPTTTLMNIADPITNYEAANKHYVDSKALPTASTADNGKVLSVVNGAWAAAAMFSGAYIGSYTGDGGSSKTLTFNFKPGAIFIVGTQDQTSYMFTSIRGSNKIIEINGASGDITWNNTSIVLDKATYSNLFVNGCIYYYAVIPAMN